MKEDNCMRLLRCCYLPVTVSALLFALVGCSSSQSAGKSKGAKDVDAVAMGPWSGLSRKADIAQFQIDAAEIYSKMIEYFAPAEHTVELPRVAPRPLATRQMEAFLRFAPGSSDLQPSYGGNQQELERIDRELVGLVGGGTADIMSIRISGYASPDGNTRRNEELATERAMRYSSYLEDKLSPQDKTVLTVDQCIEDWDGLRRLVVASGKPYASRVTAVLESVSDPEARRKALRAINNGAAWSDMEKTIFSRLRRMQLDVTYRVPAEQQSVVAVAPTTRKTDVAVLLRRFATQPDDLTLSEMMEVALAYRPGTEQYREVYELAAYRYPSNILVQLNAAAAALSQGDTKSARYFMSRVDNDPRAWINQGVLYLMEGDKATAANCFRKSLERNPRKARENLRLIGD